MKRSLTLFLKVVLLFLAFEALSAASASAHRIIVFAWVEGDTVFVESKFPGSKPVKGGKVHVSDLTGNELASGLTGEQGRFSSKLARRTDLRIRVNAGQGHQGEWIVRTKAFEDSPPEKAADKLPVEQLPYSRSKPSSQPEVGFGNGEAFSGINAKKMEAVIESVLDRKLKPIYRALAGMQQKGPGVSDIIAGIGYILGLVGIAAYVHNRKKKG